MTLPLETPGVETTGMKVVRILAGVIGGLATAGWALMLVTPIASLLDTDPRSDPHGYAMVFGTVLSIPAGVIAAAIVPFALPQRWWTRGFAVTFAVFAVGEAALFATLFVLSR